MCWRAAGQGAAVRWIIAPIVQMLQTWTLNRPTPANRPRMWERDWEEDLARLRALWVKPVRQMTVFALCRGETGSGHIAESNLYAIRSNDRVKSLTAAHRKHVSALTDARYRIRGRTWPFFRWLVFRRVAAIRGLNRTPLTRSDYSRRNVYNKA